MNLVDPADLLIIFMFLASVGITLFIVLAVWGGVLVIRILWDLQRIAQRVRVEADHIADDVGTFRKVMEKTGMYLLRDIRAFGKMASLILKKGKNK